MRHLVSVRDTSLILSSGSSFGKGAVGIMDSGVALNGRRSSVGLNVGS
jgi:hypothetical protein